jgi:hypothetical protein
MIQTRNPRALGSAFAVIPLLVLLTFLCFNMIYVAIARQSLGRRTGAAWFYFSLDTAFWKLLGVYLLMLLVFGAFAIGAVVVVVILSAAGGLLALAYMNQLGTQVYALLPLLVPVVLVLYAILLSLLISSSTFAYRALVPASNSEGVAAEFA